MTRVQTSKRTRADGGVRWTMQRESLRIYLKRRQITGDVVVFLLLWQCRACSYRKEINEWHLSDVILDNSMSQTFFCSSMATVICKH